ncbi:myelin-oligodendrocyte glycoprotein isoform X6 [Equus przewalskii]|uniref:Myelin-oligodendrocyte glycoprotein isoform X6 n=1 Tax=Equus przewalskii TaxID=9798 RepID=A0ABM4LIX4_EQUPR
MASLLSSSLSSCLPSLLLFLQMSSSYAGQFRVIGPGHPIRALVGDEVELPCRISPGKNATGMEVGWYRPPFSRVVHLYRNGKDQDGEQAPEYRGRTELLRDTIGEGKVTLRIRNVRFSDEGGFTCFFRDHSYQEEAAMELKVEGKLRAEIENLHRTFGQFLEELRKFSFPSYKLRTKNQESSKRKRRAIEGSKSWRGEAGEHGRGGTPVR